MQYPYNLGDSEYDVLYKSLDKRSTYYDGDDEIDSDKIKKLGEPEIVLYKVEGNPVSLAVQGHPEMIPTSPVAEMISELVEKYSKEVKKV